MPATSIGENFQLLSGLCRRSWKRSSCVSRPMSIQNLKKWMPSLTIISSNRGTSFEELRMLLGRAEAHHRLDPGAIVPGAVEGHELSGGRELADVALEIPLSALGLGRLGQCDVARPARVHVLADRIDRAALAGGVASLEDASTRLPLFCIQACSFTSSICSFSSSPSNSSSSIFLS